MKLLSDEKIPNNIVIMFLNHLFILMNHNDHNIKVFRNKIGFKQFIIENVFQDLIIKSPQRSPKIYETSLKLFNMFIESIENPEESQFEGWNESSSGETSFQ